MNSETYIGVSAQTNAVLKLFLDRRDTLVHNAAGPIITKTGANITGPAFLDLVNVSGKWYVGGDGGGSAVVTNLVLDPAAIGDGITNTGGTVLWTDTVASNIPAGAGRVCGCGVAGFNSVGAATLLNLYFMASTIPGLSL
jgi:hypothetical protein